MQRDHVCGVPFIKFKNDLYTGEARTNFGIIQYLNPLNNSICP